MPKAKRRSAHGPQIEDNGLGDDVALLPPSDTKGNLRRREVTALYVYVEHIIVT